MSSPFFPPSGHLQLHFNPNANLLQANTGREKKSHPTGLDGLFGRFFFFFFLFLRPRWRKKVRASRVAHVHVSLSPSPPSFFFYFIFTGSSQLGASIIGEQGASGGAGVVSHCLGCPGAPGTPVGIKVALIKCGPRRTALCIAGANREPTSHPTTTTQPHPTPAVLPVPLRIRRSR